MKIKVGNVKKEKLYETLMLSQLSSSRMQSRKTSRTELKCKISINTGEWLLNKTCNKNI